MSKKPLKKSDMGKSWIKPRRNISQMVAPEYHLIVSEGTDTEPAYFEAIKGIVESKYRGRIFLDISGKGDNTVNLFYRAQTDVLNSNIVYKHVWLVYDKDDFPAEHFDRTSQLCLSACSEETTYHAIWSNQCIELWFLLHFMFLQSDLHRSEYWPKLSENLKAIGYGEYAKNRSDMFEILRPYMKYAISNAQKLEEYNSGKTPSGSVPGTMVHLLIDTLKPYL